MKRSSLKKVNEIKGLAHVLTEVKSPHSGLCLKCLAPLLEWVEPHEADMTPVKDLERFYEKARNSELDECIFLNLVLDKIGLLLKYMEDASDETFDRTKIRELNETMEQARNQINLK